MKIISGADDFKERHNHLVNMGGTTTFPDYNPHITLTHTITPYILNNSGLTGFMPMTFLPEEESIIKGEQK